jgi:exodeoxyribonuclease VII small subunit
MAELEQILADLERSDLDVDVLGTKVARAAELIRACRERISQAKLEVEQVVADLELGDP